MFFAGYLLLLLFLTIYSYGFIDLNLPLTSAPWFEKFQAPLSNLIFHRMPLAGIIYVLLISGLYVYYVVFLQSNVKSLLRLVPVTAIILLFSFPGFSYDIFNYMTTARVAYTHKENPYIVMPVEIPNEPGLAYTRAANKVALYGPAWLLLTWIPHTLGQGNVWLTILSFKAFVALFYVAMLYLIWKITKNIKQVLFFGLNPLVLIEVLVSGHNDIVMMVPALLAFGAASKNIWKRVFAWGVSVGVKGATIVLFPLVLFPVPDREKLYKMSYWLMFGVFIVVAPFREELYPWYAVWFLAFAALIPMKKRSFIHGFSIALCIGLSLRHLPYILTREYGGTGPILRILFTIIPAIGYIVWHVRSYGKN